jgi:hypothetical protein
MRAIGALFLICFFVLAGSTPAFCYGAVAIGNYTIDSQDYVVIRNEPSAESARAKALDECKNRLKGCEITHEFVDSWLSIVTSTKNGRFYAASAADPGDAQKNARYLCTLWNDESYCRMGGPPLWSDGKAQVAPPRQRREARNLPPEPSMEKPPVGLPAPTATLSPAPHPTQQAFRIGVLNETGIIEFRYLTYISITILALLFMWLLWAISIRTPPSVMHTYILVAAWIAVPLLFAIAGEAIGFDDSPSRYVWNVLVPAFVQLYAIVYLLLYIGNRWRMKVAPHERERADHVFLRLPALTVVIPLALALYTAQHQLRLDVEVSTCLFLTLTVLCIGYFIRPYRVDETGAVQAIEPTTIETEQVLEQQAAVELPPEATEVELSANTLPAVILQSTEVLEPMPPLEGIVLKLKRSQKTSAMGNVIYMLDARIDASRETLDLIGKHSLGGRVIYESEARQKHAASTVGHLAASADGPGIFASPADHAKAAAKTVWKLGRAAVSAVRMSLALRITVNSLLSGVHVECKDMEELLEAEDAIRTAKENLEGFIETAKTFDGREEIH